MKSATARNLTLNSSHLSLAACTFFFLAGQAFIPLLGIQDDEALFAGPLYDPRTAIYTIHAGHSTLPLMVMSYVGTLKTLIFSFVFHAFRVSVWTVREPALLIAAASVWLFFLVLRRTAGERAAVIGCALLAADSIYLLTACYDWGPVALQHLLIAGGFLLLVRFYQTHASLSLTAGCFLMGLALWDKALAIWMLSGLGIATILTYPRQIIAVTGFRRLAIAVLAFAAGALPLLIFNAHTGFATFRQNTVWNLRDIPTKARFLAAAAHGATLLPYFAHTNDETPAPHLPHGPLGRASAALSAFTGRSENNGLVWAFVLALLLTPLAGKNSIRAILFCLIALIVAWLQMAANVGTGGSSHHTILLWPLPQAIIAISFAGASRRLGRAAMPVLAAGLILLLAANVLVTNVFYAQITRNGGSASWSDAIFPLSGYLKSAASGKVFCMDWGMLTGLLMLNRGHLNLQMATDPIQKPQLTAEDRETVNWVISQPGALFVAHTRQEEFYHGVNENLAAYAAGQGYQRQTLAVIPDSYGRPVFEVYQLVQMRPE